MNSKAKKQKIKTNKQKTQQEFWGKAPQRNVSNIFHKSKKSD